MDSVETAKERRMRRLPGALAAVGLAVVLLAAGLLTPFEARRSVGAPKRTAPTQPAPSTSLGHEQLLDRSIMSLQSILRANPRDWKSYASLGLAYLQKARLTVDPAFYTKADQVLRESLGLNRSQNFEADLGMGILAGARHRFHAALAWGLRAKAINPYNADIRGVIGDALMELGRYRAAERDLQKMVDLRPDIASYARISYYRELHGDVHGAKTAMSMAFEAAGGTGEDAAWASYQLGDLDLSQGRTGLAEYDYRRAAYLAPDYFLPRVGLAKVAAARGRYAVATTLLSGVIDRYPLPSYVALLGDLYARSGKPARARAEYELVRAEERLFEANGVVPDAEMMIFFADHHQRLRRTLVEARAQYRKRPSVRMADALSWVLYANGRFAQAERYSTKALRLGTRDAMYYFHAGMIARAAGYPAKALRYLETALAINRHFSVLYASKAARVRDALEASSQ
jgi:tetratricopeptide (TPR) repeat protein